jgi:glycosyl transferase, family 25
MNMNIIVISLERAKDRREKIVQQLNALKLDAIIMDAVDGQQLSKEQLNRVINNPIGWRSGETFKPGELGCLMSTIKAIKLAKENNFEYVIMLDDDVVLSEDFEKGIKFLFRILPIDWEHIFLSGHTYMAAAPVFQPSLVPATFKVSGSYAYILKNIAYDKVINEMSQMEIPVDDVIEGMILREQKLRSYIFFPFLVYPRLEYSYIWNDVSRVKEHPSVKYFKNKL